MIDESKLKAIIGMDINEEEKRFNELIAQHQKLIDAKANHIFALNKCKVGNVVLNNKGISTGLVIVGKAFIRGDNEGNSMFVIPVCTHFDTSCSDRGIYVNRSGAIDYLLVRLSEFDAFDTVPFDVYLNTKQLEHKSYKELVSLKESLIKEIHDSERKIEFLKKEIYNNTARLDVICNFVETEDKFADVYPLMTKETIEHNKDMFLYIGDSQQSRVEKLYDERGPRYIHRYANYCK